MTQGKTFLKIDPFSFFCFSHTISNLLLTINQPPFSSYLTIGCCPVLSRPEVGAHTGNGPNNVFCQNRGPTKSSRFASKSFIFSFIETD